MEVGSSALRSGVRNTRATHHFPMMSDRKSWVSYVKVQPFIAAACHVAAWQEVKGVDVSQVSSGEAEAEASRTNCLITA